MATAVAPRHPRWAPLGAGQPSPAVVRVEKPAAVVARGPAKGVVVDPRPAPLGVLPMPVGIGAKVGAHDGTGRHKHQTVPGVLYPAAVGVEWLDKVIRVADAGGLFVGVLGGRLGSRIRGGHLDLVGRGRGRLGGGGQPGAGTIVHHVDGAGHTASVERCESSEEGGGVQAKRQQVHGSAPEDTDGLEATMIQMHVTMPQPDTSRGVRGLDVITCPCNPPGTRRTHRRMLPRPMLPAGP